MLFLCYIFIGNITAMEISQFYETLRDSLHYHDLALFKTVVEGVIQKTGTIDYEGFSINQTETLLHKTVRSDFLEGTALLLQKGASIEARDFQDYTPLHLAACNASLDHIKLLLSYGASQLARSNQHLSSVMHLAAYYDRSEIIEFFLKQGVGIDPDKEKKMYTPLFVALVTGKTSALQTLLQNNALQYNDSPEDLMATTVIGWPLAFASYDYCSQYFSDKKQAFTIMLDYCNIPKLRELLTRRGLLTITEVYKNPSFQTILDVTDRQYPSFAYKKRNAKKELRLSLDYLEHYEEHIKSKFVNSVNSSLRNIHTVLRMREYGSSIKK